MRIGEIAVVGPEATSKAEFVESASDEVLIKTNDFIFGRLKVNSELMVHLYGLDFRSKDENPSWDLVSRKILGYVILFDWESSESLSVLQENLDFLSTRYHLPVVIAANLQASTNWLPQKLTQADFNLSEYSEFTFCNTADPESVKKVLVLLINSVIEKLN